MQTHKSVCVKKYVNVLTVLYNKIIMAKKEQSFVYEHF